MGPAVAPLSQGFQCRMSLLGCILASHLGLRATGGLSNRSQYRCRAVTVLRQGLCVLRSHRVQRLSLLRFCLP